MRTNAVLFASLLGLIAGDASAARILVTTEDPGIGTGACSLQEAIYSSILHDTLDGTRGIAIDATDPDHFITTQCVLGDGNDTIVLPTKGMLTMKKYLDGDAYNPYGPTATPLIFSTITIEGNGAMLQWDPDIDDPQNARLFAIGVASIRTPNGTASGTGSLTLRNVHVMGFRTKGGDGANGGGGGLGAGGAVYVHNGASIVVENSTFQSNQAIGGNGASTEKREGGGGGGLSGNGGEQNGGSGGGGGARDGGAGSLDAGGGGGGGTVFAGGVADIGGSGGYLCGGNGGSIANDGADGKCPGGGGGGSGDGGGGQFENPTGGNGAYGGGGGGGFANGGNGGFGGGGGGGNGNSGGDGGNGGFGGGAGTADDPGTGGPFGGNASGTGGGGGGGGGGALGGAIFGDHGTITVRNSTFTNNSVTRGVGGPGAENGGDGGGAIFSHDGDVTILNSTFSGNQSTGSGGAVVAYMDPPDSSLFGGPDIFINFTIENTIIANNGANECFFTGNVHAQGTHNLIMSNGSGSQPFGSCADPAVTNDPQLGALADNGGYTKTMAIPFGSVAMGAADDKGTSLPTDQRGAARPQAGGFEGGFDIGAYEVCRIKVGPVFQAAPCSELAQQDPPIFLTVLASTGGTTDPAAGNYPEVANTVVPLHATPLSGYYFTGWTDNVVTPTSASTTIIMNTPYTVGANFQLHDFALSVNPATLPIPLGGVGSTAVQATALGNFSDKVTLSATGTPTGVSTLFSINPIAPVTGTPASSIFKLTVGASARPQTFTETLKGSSTGLSGALTHTVPLNVTIVATAAAIMNVIGQEQALGCIDQSGIGQALSAKMNAYQSLASGGHVQGAVNVLSAFQYEVLGQIGHHIVTSCTDSVTGTAFSPGDTLIADAQSLQATLATPLKGAPIVGSVVSTSDAGAAGRTVNLLSGKSVVATASTDAVGFYYLDTTALKVGAQYSVTATIPKGYKASSPASQTFTWTGKALQLATFTLN
jgi:hypothetical protein